MDSEPCYTWHALARRTRARTNKFNVSPPAAFWTLSHLPPPFMLYVSNQFLFQHYGQKAEVEAERKHGMHGDVQYIRLRALLKATSYSILLPSSNSSTWS